MKIILTILLIGALAFIPPTAKCQSAPKDSNCTLLQACTVVVILGAACYTIWRIKIMCDRAFSNYNYQLTNNVDSWGRIALPPMVSTGPTLSSQRFQYCTGLGSVWLDWCRVDLQQVNNDVVGVLYKDGVAIATNSASINPTNGTACLDFSSLMAPTDSCPSTSFFRVLDVP